MYISFLETCTFDGFETDLEPNLAAKLQFLFVEKNCLGFRAVAMWFQFRC